ncbi:RHS repeat-associated core domain-containing protein [Actinosynnema sp. NPDC004786]
MRSARRALTRALTVVLALSTATGVAQPALAATGPSVDASDVASVPVTNATMASRPTDEATTRALKNDQPPAGAAKDGGGSFAATPLAASATWGVSAQSGDFTWSYPLRVPPSPGGFTPSLALSYRSSAVDGLTSATNNQPSWVGDGWDLSAGFIERVYGGCAQDDEGGTTPPETGDLCWRSDNAIASYPGGGGPLVRDDATGGWRLKSDNRSRVERVTVNGNGDNDGESWKITSVDGTQFFFGSRTDARSTWTVPVFGDDAGEPCHASTFAASSCDQAWRWNLDKVVDARGNVILYSYETETNNYGRNMADAAASYVRAGTLKRVEYGLHEDLTDPATGRVEFGLADRCVPGSTCALDRPENWPDVPLDRRCDTGTCADRHSPTFWSTKRLATITTQVRRGAAWSDVDRWTLRHEYPKADEEYNAALWLKGITHTGLVGGELSLPEVTFEGAAMPNRVDTPTGIGPLNRYRVTGVISEAGGVTTVKYAPPDCVPGTSMPGAAEHNTLRCYPVTWTRKDYAERTDHFHKYVVESITTSDRMAASAEQVVSYEYFDGAGWRYDRSEFTEDDKRTWNEFRGYGRVRTRTGVAAETSGPVTMTEQRFYRGMHGDHLPGGTRAATVTDTEGASHEDHDWLAGFRFESVTHDGTGDGVVGKEITTPVWAGPTATRGEIKAYFVARGSTTTHTALRAGGWRKTEVATSYDDHGQPHVVNDLGDVDRSDDDRCTRTSYTADQGRWMWSYPTQVETVAVACTATPTYPADALSGARTTYDADGNATQVEALDQRPASGPRFVVKTKTTYDVYGRPLTVKDAADNTTTTAYVPATGGAATEVVTTNALGHSGTTTVEPAWGVQTKAVDANENVVEADLDPLGRTVRVWQANRWREDYPDEPSTTIAYDIRNDAPSSVTTSSVGPNGNYLTSTTLYDGQYRVRQAQSPTEGGRLIVDTRYDSQGRVTRTTQPFFNAQPVDQRLVVPSEVGVPGLTRARYDGAGRPIASIFQGGGQELWRTTTSYGGDRVDVVPPQGGTPTTTITDARGQTTELWQYRGATAMGAHDTARYGYTKAGQLASTTDEAGNTWRWTYDLQGRQTGSEDVDKGPSTMTYDALGRLETVTDARGTTLRYGYDALHRRKTVHSGSTLLEEFTYDTALYGLGQPESSTRYVNGNAYTTVVRAYTGLYQPIQAEVVIPAVEGALKGTYRTEFTYKPDGSPAGVAYGAMAGLASETVLYTYDDLGRPIMSSGGLSGSGTERLVTDAKYTRYGEPYRLQLGDAGKRMWHSQYYEQHARRVERVIVDAEVASPMQADLRYTRNPAGSITSVTDATIGRPVDRQCFAYDHVQRLTEAWTPSGGCDTAPATSSLTGPAPYWHSYTYDAAGNRRVEVQHAASGNVTRTYDYPAAGTPRPHAVSSVKTEAPGGTTLDQYGYDALGNTTSRPGQVLEWDVEGKLVKVTAAGKVSEFLYAADGTRLIRRDGDATTLYLGDQELRLAKGATTPTSTRYYSFGGRVVAMREGKTNVSWLASDHQGTTQLAVNRSTMTVTRRHQLPFGGSRGNLVTFPGERGFVGGTNDAATGLVHLGARQYDPALGRFLSVDPLMDSADPQQWNGYAYSNNSPITLSDPTGMIRQCGPDGVGCGARNDDNSNAHNPVVYEQRVDRRAQVQEQVKQWTAKNSPATDDANELIWKWSAFTSPQHQGFWNNSMGDGHYACFGRRGCQEAWIYLQNGGDVATAKSIAAMYCVDNPQACDSENAQEEYVLQMQDALLGSLSFGAARAARARCFNSFTGDTEVLMADGSTKAISEVEVGEEVVATDPGTGESGPRTVTATIVGQGRKALVDLTVDLDGPDGDRTATITATDNHPIWVDDRGRWVDAGDVVAGDLLTSPDGTTHTMLSTRAWPLVAQVHNLTVSGISTYYVLAGDTPVLVHNCGPDLDKRSAMAASGIRPARGGKSGGSHAGLEYDKHQLDPNQVSSKRFLPRVGGRKDDLDLAGQKLLDEITLHPRGVEEVVTGGIFPGGTRIIMPNGWGAVFDVDGNFQFFGSFRYPG